MRSLVLSTATRYLMPLLILFSVFLLVRGHDEPGGGFVGGLVAAAAISLYEVAYDVWRARQIIRINPLVLIAAGLLIAAASGLPALVERLPYMTGLWTRVEVPIFGKLGTPLVFDIGVYLVVVGVMLTITFSLMETEDER